MRDFMTRCWSSRFLLLHACAGLAAALAPFPSGAAGEGRSHPLDEVEQVAVEYAREHTAGVRGRVEIAATGLDPRTRLAACGRTVASMTPGTRLWGRTNVLVRCDAPGGWSVSVPLLVRVHAPVVVTARPLGRGEAIGESDLTSRELDLTQLPLGVLTEPAMAVGRTTIAALPAGATLRPDMLRAPLMVIQGQQVRIIYVGDGFRVAGDGRALNSAAQHGSVQVKTPSGKVVKGIAAEPGVVEVR